MNKKGFTLVEILLAMLITSVIVLCIGSLSGQVRRGCARIENASLVNEHISIITENFRNEVGTLYLPAVSDGNDDAFNLQTYEDGSVDMSFYTLCPSWYGAGEFSRPTKVRYLYTKDNDNWQLVRYEWLCAGSKVISEPTSEIISEKIARLSVFAFDGEQKKWLADFKQSKRCPAAIKFILEMDNSKPADGKVICLLGVNVY